MSKADIKKYEENYKYLLSKGVSKAWLKERYKNDWNEGGFANVENKAVDKLLSRYKKYQSDKNNTEFRNKESSLPEEIRNDPAYKNLSQDMKEIVLYNYQIQSANDEQKAQNLATALELAIEQADPYWKNILLIAQDEVLRTFEQIKGDYDSSVQRQLRIVDNINQDLAYNKDFLNLEQQSALANIAMNYEMNHENLLNSAAGAGLSFSTKRKIAEQRLAAENQSMVESTQRSFNKQLRDIETESQRGITEAQFGIEDLGRRAQNAYTSAGRAAETYLGTGNLPYLPGYSPLGSEGPLPGQMYEEREKDIWTRQQTIANELNQRSLNLNLSNYI
jgi:hypothetical protein